ncbi:hypothetical protein GGR55DRAFT_658643 [Xylaria sp. FL0064]|nr:hypothetical protein GGR55DRAFT_658643 [Xylaria sp. FL0064]
MRSIHLGSQNTTTTSSSSKPQNFLAAQNKTKPSPTLMRNNNKNSKGNSNADDKPNPTRTVWTGAKERGQAIIRTGRSPAKRHPRITTISTTRNKNTGGGSNTSGIGTTSTAPAARIPTGTITTAVALQTPPPPLTLTPPPFANTTTNPSTHGAPPLSTASTNITTTTTTITARRTRTTTTATTQRLRPRSHLLQPHSLSLLPLAARRPPLDCRDQNVGPVFAPAVKENKKMGHDTSATPSTTTTTTTNPRPQMPSLSAAAARGINRTPLTPKISSASRASQPQTPSVATAAAATTPLPRRTQPRPTSATIAAAPNGSSRASYDDPGAVSAAAFSPHLNSNVTPRSGSRQSRVDSASSTPNGTPSHDRSDPWESTAAFPFPSPLHQADRSRRPVVTFNAVSPERNMPPRQDTTNSRDSKFFHASDAKTARPTSASKTTFFYANGNGIASKSSSPVTLSPPLSPGLNRSQENASTKFMYANGTPELRPTPPPLLSCASGSGSGSGPTVSNASKGLTVRSAAPIQRPVSPSKLPLHSSSSYRNSIGSQSAAAMSTAAVSATRVQVSPPPPLMPSTPGLRSPGTATSRSSGHSRSGSLAMGESTSEPLKPMASPIIGLFPPANLSPTQTPPLTLASIIQAADEFTEHENETNEASPDDQSMLQSPTKSTVSSVDPVIELIANARRERKVQDLQIRNASLEAINRTLERQMRKQTAELRRYRRLSRSAHLSLASTTMSSRVTSGTMSELDLESIGLSELSEEEPSMQDLEEESLSESDSVSSDISASVLAARDAKHRQRDEERLQLDLSKHQQILVDSQKINQSIRRCLDWTEELINDGRKALEYKVRVSDIRLGGRVLDPLDEEEEASKLPLSNDTVALDVEPIEEKLEIPTSWGIEPQDRDSGIELPREGNEEEG